MSRQGRSTQPIFKGAFSSPNDEYSYLGKRPMVFDILAPDGVTSVLPDSMKLVLEVNPIAVGFNYSKLIERINTKGGWVEQHWGDGLDSISLTMVTGGFKRLYSGLTNITGGGRDVRGTRRESINYDRYLDMLALFHNNGQVYDQNGQIVFSGKIKVTFDGGVYLGWFSDFNVEEAAGKPYQFDLTTNFTVDEEILRLRTMPYDPQTDFMDGRTGGFTTGGPMAGTEALDLGSSVVTKIGKALAPMEG